MGTRLFTDKQAYRVKELYFRSLYSYAELVKYGKERWGINAAPETYRDIVLGKSYADVEYEGGPVYDELPEDAQVIIDRMIKRTHYLLSQIGRQQGKIASLERQLRDTSNRVARLQGKPKPKYKSSQEIKALVEDLKKQSGGINSKNIVSAKW